LLGFRVSNGYGFENIFFGQNILFALFNRKEINGIGGIRIYDLGAFVSTVNKKHQHQFIIALLNPCCPHQPALLPERLKNPGIIIVVESR
jgi:hypothetical protein